MSEVQILSPRPEFKWLRIFRSHFFLVNALSDPSSYTTICPLPVFDKFHPESLLSVVGQFEILEQKMDPKISDRLVRFELVKIASQQPNPLQGVIYIIKKAQELYEYVDKGCIPDIQHAGID